MVINKHVEKNESYLNNAPSKFEKGISDYKLGHKMAATYNLPLHQG